MNDNFKVIERYPNYEINTDGVVRLVKTKRVVPYLKRDSIDGYRQVSLRRHYCFVTNARQHKETVFDLLTETFTEDEIEATMTLINPPWDNDMVPDPGKWKITFD
jgi:hypothetical protein